MARSTLSGMLVGPGLAKNWRPRGFVVGMEGPRGCVLCRRPHPWSKAADCKDGGLSSGPEPRGAPSPDESKKRSARRFAASQDQPPFVTTGDEPCILVMAARVVAIHGGLTPIVARPIAGDRPDGESTP